MTKMDMRMHDSLELQQTSDFFESSLPSTYDYFIKNDFHKKYGGRGGNSFDLFIKDKVPFLTFIIDQFYKNNKPQSLQLSRLTDEKMIKHLDKAILNYIVKGGEQNLAVIKDLYVYLLETCVVKLSTKK